ncbi:MAG: DUF6785 family protein [Nitrososphaerota archaeon]|nr:hypothetical protein [Candidatus Bathyarchaeota archaeon]MDW8049333.1 DUF6785 family protein [Nitrososphaerota archaeon]
MSEIIEEKIRPVTYLIGVVCVVILLAFIGYFTLFTRAGAWFDFKMGDVWTRNWCTEFTMVLFLPLITSAVAALIGPRVRKGELIVILAMMMAVWMFPLYQGLMWTVTMLGVARGASAFHRWTLGYGAERNWIFGPDPNVAEYWNSWMYGGPVPWDKWIPSLTVSILTVMPLLLSYVFLASIWRRMWIDIEALPYPLATANSMVINQVYEKTEKGTPKILANIYLWIGFVVGFILLIPWWGVDTLPWLGLSRWPEHWVYPPQTNLSGMRNSLGLYNVCLTFNMQPMWVAGAFLVPTTTLLSYIVGAFFACYLLQCLPVYLGIWEAGSYGNDVTTNWRGFTGPMMQAWTRDWGARAFSAFGAMFGLVYFPLWIHRAEVIDMIKAVFGKGSPEVEKREPMKLRYLVIGYIICVLWYVFMWDFRTTGGKQFGVLPYIAGIIWVVATGWMYMIGSARTEAEFGVLVSPINCNMFAHNWNEGMKTYWFADTGSPFYISDLKTRYLVLSADVSWFDQVFRAAPFTYLLHYFKIASLNRVHAKYILIGAIIATVVGAAITPPMLLQFWCMYGATRLKEFAYDGSPSNYFQRGPTYGSTNVVGDYWRGGVIAQPVAGQWVQFVVTAIGISCIYILRSKFPWFPLNAAGVALGFLWVVDFLFFPSIIALVLKWIILKVGGLKLYEEKAMPLMVGVAASLGLAVVVNNVAIGLSPH